MSLQILQFLGGAWKVFAFGRVSLEGRGDWQSNVLPCEEAQKGKNINKGAQSKEILEYFGNGEIC